MPAVLPRVFGLQGKDIDQALYYEIWLGIWLACALMLLATAGLRRAMRRPGAAKATIFKACDQLVPLPLPDPRWNVPTILLVLVGLGALGGAVLDAHRTASFLAGSIHVIGEIADPRAHPVIRFTATDGAVFQFTQNGFVSRPLGAAVPVAYQTWDPGGTAQVDTFWVNWSTVLGLLWIGFGSTLALFFGFRAVMQAGRW
ncbi:MAG: hypothetical protein EON48_03810 [Acetobacteraceae bacterium]|nr:MAG: hypothetical protein EON48_03810 [Acetobacteraceae bacterium]